MKFFINLISVVICATINVGINLFSNFGLISPIEKSANMLRLANKSNSAGTVDCRLDYFNIKNYNWWTTNWDPTTLVFFASGGSSFLNSDTKFSSFKYEGSEHTLQSEIECLGILNRPTKNVPYDYKLIYGDYSEKDFGFGLVRDDYIPTIISLSTANLFASNIGISQVKNLINLDFLFNDSNGSKPYKIVAIAKDSNLMNDFSSNDLWISIPFMYMKNFRNCFLLTKLNPNDYNNNFSFFRSLNKYLCYYQTSQFEISVINNEFLGNLKFEESANNSSLALIILFVLSVVYFFISYFITKYNLNSSGANWFIVFSLFAVFWSPFLVSKLTNNVLKISGVNLFIITMNGCFMSFVMACSYLIGYILALIFNARKKIIELKI